MGPCQALEALSWQTAPNVAYHTGKKIYSPPINALLQEVQRVSLFVRFHYDREWSALLQAAGELKAVGEQLLRQGAGEEESTTQRLAKVHEALDEIGKASVNLDVFLRHNVATCPSGAVG